MGGARLIFLSVGVGPIVNRVSRFLMLKALKKADYRSYRETVAFDYLKSVGYDTSGDLLYPDLVFSLPKDTLPAPKAAAGKPFVVGLGLINYYGWGYDSVRGERIYQEYTSKIKCFVDWLLDQGHTIRIISGDDVDQRPVYEIMEYVAKNKPSHQQNLIVEKISDVGELFRQIAQTDIVVASRFHNVLCSLMLERPVISLGYHAKNDALMAEMGLESYCQHIESFTFEKLVGQFERYTAEMESAVQRLHHKNEQYRELLDEQYRAVLMPQPSGVPFARSAG
jgi:polysaccharide pyruvyl transferase WcaK-like protein